jgi:cyanate permease
MGAVYDNSGSYRPAWIALLIFSIIIAVCLTAAEITYKKLKIINKHN